LASPRTFCQVTLFPQRDLFILHPAKTYAAIRWPSTYNIRPSNPAFADEPWAYRGLQHVALDFTGFDLAWKHTYTRCPDENIVECIRNFAYSFGGPYNRDKTLWIIDYDAPVPSASFYARTRQFGGDTSRPGYRLPFVFYAADRVFYECGRKRLMDMTNSDVLPEWNFVWESGCGRFIKRVLECMWHRRPDAWVGVLACQFLDGRGRDQYCLYSSGLKIAH